MTSDGQEDREIWIRPGRDETVLDTMLGVVGLLVLRCRQGVTT